MIEFVLLFALGFLAAALVALIVAPVIHRRVVSLTERRIRASVPLSVAEIRAEKDMARAAFAAENARLSVDLKHNRDQLTESTAHGTRLSKELVAIRAEKLNTETLLEERDGNIRDLQSKVNERDAQITTLTGNFSDAARLAEARKHEIAARDDQINRLGTEIEELRIDLVTLDTEAENFKSQIRELRSERNALRESLNDAEATSRDLQNKLNSTDQRLSQNEEKLAKAITALSDRENALERRVAEVDRFKKKNRELSDELRAARKEAREAQSLARKAAAANGSNRTPQQTVSTPEPAEIEDSGTDVAQTEPETKSAPQATPVVPAAQAVQAAPAAAKQQTVVETPQDLEQLTEEEKVDRLRARQSALIERLMKADKPGNDAALRRELAVVASMMIELTASRDGSSSPVFRILKGSEALPNSGDAEPSLAARASDMLARSN
ncbi:hypothetical protein [uncultured Hoeflea sp.]|uniref:hypothetical protein n=1 Tax=uncultured Hoeflea sp. TaxID=538666 RepID=UPI0030DB2401